MNVTNRQRKFLNFFGIKFSPKLTLGAAGFEISEILADEKNLERWEKYLYLTKDFDSDSPELNTFDPTELEAVSIPDNWTSSEKIRKFNSEIVANELANASPFDMPQPDVQFKGKTFAFTGKFVFGTRKACQEAVKAYEGFTPSRSSVSGETDFLVIGGEGSPHWKRGSYGNKIEAAILARRNYGRLAIISEDHWKKQMENADRSHN